jgi:hypothetical protein
VQTGRPSLRPTTVRLAFAVVVAVVALTVAELTSERFREFMSDHSLVSTFIAEAILLAVVYLVIDEIIERREARRWGDVTSLGLRALSPVAHRPGEIVRRAVDELAVETGRAHPALRHDGDEVSASEPADYEELVSVHADELGDWLRANEERARSFAEETRQSAFRLEEAIIRWGPTLVESPDSAELLNLLPDIVDATRSAAQAIVPASGRLHPVRGGEGTAIPIGGWTEDDRRRFKDSVLEILRSEGKFDQRLPR